MGTLLTSGIVEALPPGKIMREENSLPFSPAADRNKTVILPILTDVWPARAQILEIASGTGQHAQYFARSQPHWHWHPSDADLQSLQIIGQRCAGLVNVAAPRHLDLLTTAQWPDMPRLDGLYCANLLHISPWDTCAALMAAAKRLLVPGGALVVYGPFVEDDVPLAPSNRAFDADLRMRNPDWGLRALSAVRRVAQDAGLLFDQRLPMPANNLTLIWRLPVP